VTRDPGAARDYGHEAHELAEEHLDSCFEALDAEGDLGEEAEWPAILAAPFCGCTTCVVREVLNAAWPILVEARDAR